jgi:hypothetical protein
LYSSRPQVELQLSFEGKRPKDCSKMTDLSLTCTHNGD